MTARWVAGGVRARAMARRRLGTTGVRALAGHRSLADALAALSGPPYGRQLRPDLTLAQAQRAVGDTLLWNVRVLAGWLPASGAEQLRVLAGWFEIANVDEQLRRLRGEPADQPYRLGRLATAWPRLAATTSAAEVRGVLSTSAWRDPGGDTPRLIATGMRLAWARRVVATVTPAAGWATAATALLVARERFIARRRLPDSLAATAAVLLGPAAVLAGSLADFGRALPAPARWVMAGVRAPADLWLAETAWWGRVHADGAALLAGARFGPDLVLGSCALLSADAWRVGAVLELVARGAPPEVRHVVA